MTTDPHTTLPAWMDVFAGLLSYLFNTINPYGLLSFFVNHVASVTIAGLFILVWNTGICCVERRRVSG